VIIADQVEESVEGQDAQLHRRRMARGARLAGRHAGGYDHVPEVDRVPAIGRGSRRRGSLQAGAPGVSEADIPARIASDTSRRG
jgi:hypothetical protein